MWYFSLTFLIPPTKTEGGIARIYYIPQYHPLKGIQYNIKHTAFGWGCYGRLPHSEKISPSTSSRMIFFLLVVIYRNTLNLRQYVYIIHNLCYYENRTMCVDLLSEHHHHLIVSKGSLFSLVTMILLTWR